MPFIPEKTKIISQETPLEYLDNLSKNFKVNFYLKRDDLTNLGLGGNKLRKLEYLVKEAKDNDVTTLITYGGVQSNHCRLTAAVAAKYNMKCIILSIGDKPDELSANLLIDRILGAKVIIKKHDGRSDEEQLNELVAKVTKDCEENNEKSMYIPLGGSNEYGFLGYYECGQELNKQLEEYNIKSGRVFTAVGSLGTYLGLLCGLKSVNSPLSCEGIGILPFDGKLKQRLTNYFNDVNQKFDLGLELDNKDFIVYEDYLYGGYNKESKEVRETIYLMAREEGILLDPCYTGKCFTGIIQLIKKGIIKEGENIIFIHTGGTPALYTKHHRIEFEKELFDDITFLD